MKSANLFTNFRISFLLVAYIVSFLFTTSSCEKEILPRDKFLGIYSVTETCSFGGEFTYNITIAESSISNDVVTITPFGNYDDRIVIATVNRTWIDINDTIGDIIFEGSGELSTGINLSINYSASQARRAQYSCKKTCIK